MNARKLTDDQARELIAARRKGVKCTALAKQYGIAASTVSAIANGRAPGYARLLAEVPPEPEFVPDYIPPPPTKRELLTAERLKQEIEAKRLGLAFPVFKRTIGEIRAALADIERRALARRRIA